MMIITYGVYCFNAVITTISEKIDRKTYLLKMVNKEIQETIERTFLNAVSKMNTFIELIDLFDLFFEDEIKDFGEKLIN